MRSYADVTATSLDCTSSVLKLLAQVQKIISYKVISLQAFRKPKFMTSSIWLNRRRHMPLNTFLILIGQLSFCLDRSQLLISNADRDCWRRLPPQLLSAPTQSIAHDDATDITSSHESSSQTGSRNSSLERIRRSVGRDVREAENCV